MRILGYIRQSRRAISSEQHVRGKPTSERNSTAITPARGLRLLQSTLLAPAPQPRTRTRYLPPCHSLVAPSSAPAPMGPDRGRGRNGSGHRVSVEIAGAPVILPLSDRLRQSQVWRMKRRRIRPAQDGRSSRRGQAGSESSRLS